MSGEISAGAAPPAPAPHDDPFRVLAVEPGVLRETFEILRACGAGMRECQVLWTAEWRTPQRVTRAVHSKHSSNRGGFRVDDAWLTAFWAELAERNDGIRVQVHTHPGEAFHSQTDDEWPVVHTPGFLSLVIPNFAQGEPSFTGAYLCGIDSDGTWRELDSGRWLSVIGQVIP